MTKKLSIDLDYDAPVEAVSAMIADPAFREKVCQAQRSITQSVAIAAPTVTIRYTQAADGLPGFAKKFVGDKIEIFQDETWNADFTAGDIAITLPGKPGSLAGQATVKPNGTGTRENVTLAATVNLPLIGGKLEDLILGLFRKALVKEHQVGVAWLAEH